MSTGMGTRPEVSEGRRSFVGLRSALATIALTVVAVCCGVALALLQQWNIRAGWDACFSGVADGNGNVHNDPAAYMDAGYGFASTVEALTRLVGYPTVLVIASVTGWVLGRRAMGNRWGLAVYTAAILLAAVVTFWWDYRQNNWLSIGDWQSRCPDGHPPWWPGWLGVHPSS